MQLYYQPLIGSGSHYLDEEESRHATRVLRSQIGDTISVTDGLGNLYQAKISDIKKNACHFDILNVSHQPKKKYSIHLCVAPTKNLDRMEWMVEKATELGVDEISFVVCQNSERTHIKFDRLQKKAISALKQSKQAWLPTVNTITPFEQALDFDGLKFIAHWNGIRTSLPEIPLHQSYKILIGPEGDFSQNEIIKAIAHHFQMIGLGETILRTETAALVACHTFHIIHLGR